MIELSSIQSQNLLVESEAKYNLLINSVKDYAIFMLDREGHIVTWNSGAQKIKGYTKEEILYKNFSILHTKEDRERNHPSYILEIVKRNGRFEEEGWRVRKNGRKFWANVSISAVYNNNKELIGYSKVTRDLTERKNLENKLLQSSKELKESEERSRLLISGVKDYAIFLVSPDGTIASWNEGARQIKGYEADEVMGQHISKFYLPEAVDNKYPQYELKKSLEVGRFEDEGWRIRKDGSQFWANVIITPIFNNTSQHIGFTKITRDLTERKILEDNLRVSNEELKKSEETMRLLISGVKDYAIFLLTKEGNIATWNDGARRIKGYEMKEVLGCHFSMFYLPKAISAQYPAFELYKAIQDGSFEDEGWRLRKDGSKFWANVLITPIYNSQNQHLGFTKITRDLTERIKNEELMGKNQELHRLNLDLDNFIYAASHDLKTPIANIEGLISVILKSLPSEILNNDPINMVMDLMQKSIDRFKITISNLTDVVKLQKENNQGATRLNISEILQEVLLDMKHITELEGAVIHTEVDCSIPIQFSKNNLRSIVYNLISNAIKYRSPDRLPIVWIDCQETDEYVIFKVQDNGLGMDLPDTSVIFKMFQRLHTHVDGTGIGLYMVKRIIENARGRIEVQSKSGEGSTFTVFFKRMV